MHQKLGLTKLLALISQNGPYKWSVYGSSTFFFLPLMIAKEGSYSLNVLHFRFHRVNICASKKAVISHILIKVCSKQFSVNYCIDSCVKDMTQVNWNILLIKSSKNVLFFLPAFYPNSLLMISPKNLEKNSHFENMTAGFLLSCQNSLRQTTPEIKYFQGWQNRFSPILPL